MTIAAPFNEAAHDHLLSHGYGYERVDESDDVPACDIYECDGETVYVQDGGTVERNVWTPMWEAAE